MQMVRRIFLALLLLVGVAQAQAPLGIQPQGLFIPPTAKSVGAVVPMPSSCPANQWLTGVFASSFNCVQPNFSNLSGTATDSQLASAYSGTGSCSAHQWAIALTRNASPTCAQPACGDLSNAGSACQANTGTSGFTVPLLNGNNTFSGTSNFTGPFQINGVAAFQTGTWTPTLTGSTGAPTVTYTTRGGTWAIEGPMLHATWSVGWSALSGGAGLSEITGLPQPTLGISGNNNWQSATCQSNGVGGAVEAYIPDNSSILFPLTQAGANVGIASFSATGFFWCSIAYRWQ